MMSDTDKRIRELLQEMIDNENIEFFKFSRGLSIESFKLQAFYKIKDDNNDGSE